MALEMYLVVVDFRHCDPQDRTQVVSADLAYRHDPLGVTKTISEPKWTFVDGPVVHEQMGV